MQQMGNEYHEDRVETVLPGSFEPSAHFYPKALNAHIHPLVKAFLSLGNDRIAKRYCHLHPEADPEKVAAVFSTPTRYLQWAGADLMVTTTAQGQKRIVIIETNSCPAGQKCMPHADAEASGYHMLLQRTLLPQLHNKPNSWSLLAPPSEGVLAVLYDKNHMEASGYAAALADVAGEPVFLVPAHVRGSFRVRRDGVLEIHGDGTRHVAVRAALRYVTKRPWSGIPPLTRTLILNPVLACLAGGRNKTLAAKAYEEFNAGIGRWGLRIHTPHTVCDVAKPQIPVLVRRMGGLAVVKVPYSHAGLGVWTLTTEHELENFMALHHPYDRFIVQALIGNKGWSSVSQEDQQEQLYHVGTVPNEKGNIYAADLRFMVASSPNAGFFPVALFGRRAGLPLNGSAGSSFSSWDVLGTNLSLPSATATANANGNCNGATATDTSRLLLVDSLDFNSMGLGLDDLIEAYMQSVLAVLAIDKLACKLVTSQGQFRSELFRSLNPDPNLLDELYPAEFNPPLQLQLQQPQPKDEENAAATKTKATEDQNGHAHSISEDTIAAQLKDMVGEAQSLQLHENFPIALN